MNTKTTLGRTAIEKFLSKYIIVIGILIMTIYTCIVQPRFCSTDNLVSLINQFVPLGLVSLGMTLVIISGYIDLSVAGIFSLMGIISTMLVNIMGSFGIVIALAIGGLCGLIDAIILIFCGARDDSEALFITFGIQTAFAALALIINKGNLVTLNGTSFTDFLGGSSIAGIPVSMYVFAIITIILYVFMKKTPMGRKIYLVGGNPVASALSGVNNNKIIIFVYVAIGVLATIGSFTQACRVGSALPISGKNFETNAIMAVAIGGTSLSGGKGSVLNTVLGVALVTIMANALNMLGIDANMQNVWKGVILVAAIWLDSRRNS